MRRIRNKQFAVRLAQDERAALAELAYEQDVTASTLVRHLIREMLATSRRGTRERSRERVVTT